MLSKDLHSHNDAVVILLEFLGEVEHSLKLFEFLAHCKAFLERIAAVLDKDFALN